MRLLVLDLATSTGYAFGTSDGGVVEHGTHKFPSTGNDIAAFLGAYRAWFETTCGRLSPDEIVFEMPILPGIGNLGTLRKLYSLCGLTELLARDRRCAVSEANLMDIRNHFLGRRSAPKEIKSKEARRRWLKNRTIEVCRERGFRPVDDNSADALALFSFAMSNRVKGFELRGNELERAA